MLKRWWYARTNQVKGGQNQLEKQWFMLQPNVLDFHGLQTYICWYEGVFNFAYTIKPVTVTVTSQKTSSQVFWKISLTNGLDRPPIFIF